MTTETYDELKARYRHEWQERKARRMEMASQYAEVIGTVKHNGSTLVFKRAMRSKGYQSNYQQVPQYWCLEYQDGKLTHGRSLTERAYQQGKEYALKHHGIVLP